MLDELTGIGRQLVEIANADRELAHRPWIGQLHRNRRMLWLNRKDGFNRMAAL